MPDVEKAQGEQPSALSEKSSISAPGSGHAAHDHEHERAAGLDEEDLRRGLSSRQVSMIASGPASLLLNYSIVGGIVFLVMLCLGEMATEFPLAGSFSTYSTRFVDPAFGFAIGWNYWANDAISVAGDLTAAQLIMSYWTDHLTWLPSIFFWVFLLVLNSIHVKAYGELEYWLSLLKIISIIIFFFLGIAVNVGGNTAGTYIGGQYWTLGEAPFVGGFGGFASLFVTASFAFGGTESIGITAGETKNPTRNMPRVIRNVFFRIIIFYILTVIIIGFDIPYNTPNLSNKVTATSPFTLVFAKAGSTAGGSFMNTVILTSILSAGNHALYAGTRVLYGLAVVRQAPAIFKRTNRNGVPYVALAATSSVSLVFFGASFLPNGGAQIWNWAQNLVGVSNQIAWWCIGVASWRFRAAWQKQGRQISDLKYPNPAGAWAAPIVVVSVTFIILVQGWSAFAPWDTESFFASYVELPLFLILYLGWRVVKGIRTPSVEDIDVDSGRYVEREEDKENNETIDRREKGKFGWAWKLYNAVL
ncbi:amino acid transmembrane transporter [Pseudohyphozyma bogoriensis]|nr:amino acid transmembrane transporter [Pseudohyphozyma bogoriensis]